MLKRLRDIKKYVRPVGEVSHEDWEDINARFINAKNFLDDKNPIYLMLKEELKKAENIILENRVHEVQERRTISDTFIKVFTTPKQEQLDELVGQIKFIRSLLSEVESWFNRKVELEKLESEGKILIDREKEKHG